MITLTDLEAANERTKAAVWAHHEKVIEHGHLAYLYVCDPDVRRAIYDKLLAGFDEMERAAAESTCALSDQVLLSNKILFELLSSK